jgi:hypothetical protein
MCLSRVAWVYISTHACQKLLSGEPVLWPPAVNVNDTLVDANSKSFQCCWGFSVVS